ncbi:MAG: class I SAM-dependent methyltransferase [Desulfobacteraceae bacterium]|nr:class I SAM-dependent methyltransferase [Desulfobacteraceae bacterium]
MKSLIRRVIPVFDPFFAPFVYIAAWILKIVRRAGIQRLPLCKKTLLKVGVFPIRNHYHEPQFDFRDTSYSFFKERDLPGINWNIEEQLKILEKLKYSSELKNIPTKKTHKLEFFINNEGFGPGDAEYWYQLIRLKRPKRIFEIGSGNSTLIAINAIRKNEEESAEYECRHVCIEPYEAPWLEQTGVSVIREKVENMDISFFSELEEGDILFIDSSHIIKPEGDVVFEYLQLFPRLNRGVIVHVHDVFSPRNCLNEWVKNSVQFWNEQYLLEAFLTNNVSWKIIASINYLHNNHYSALKKTCPFLTPDKEPGSFYIQKEI